MAAVPASRSLPHGFPWRTTCAAAVGVVLFLTGCALPGQDDAPPVPGMEPARLEAVRAAAQAAPSFRPGDSLTYGNPARTWTVAALGEEGRIAWRADNGDAQITAANTLLPPLEWRSAAEGSGKRLISGQSDSFFPLRAGKTVRFRDTAESDRPPYAWEYVWTCRIEGLAPVTVPAGTFPAHPIACERADGALRTLHYAPELGAPVRIVERASPEAPEQIRPLLRFSMAGGPQMTAQSAGELGQAAAADDPPAVAPLSPVEPVEGEDLGEGPGQGQGQGPRPLGMLAQAEGDGLTLPPAENPVQPAPADMPESGLETGTQASQGPPPADQTASAQAAPAGTIAVHLASYKNPDNAESGWRSLLAANRDQLGDARPLIRRVDLGSKGVFYRLHAGPLQNRSAAESICRTLSQRGVYCKVATL
jgi:cell division septation protein DedD